MSDIRSGLYDNGSSTSGADSTGTELRLNKAIKTLGAHSTRLSYTNYIYRYDLLTATTIGAHSIRLGALLEVHN